MKKKRKKNGFVSAYETYALADVDSVDPRDNTTTPSEDSVIEAKKWVETNEK